VALVVPWMAFATASTGVTREAGQPRNGVETLAHKPQIGLSCLAMSHSGPALGNLSAERFAKVCKATRWNVRTALDLIFIHAEKEVRGRQPRASLNPLTVLSAAAAYERFFTDLYAAAKDPASVNDQDRWEPGRSKTEIRSHWNPDTLATELQNVKAVGNLTGYWSAWMADGWFGASPTDWTFRKYSEEPGAFHQALQDVHNARNGAAHFILPKVADRSKIGYEPVPVEDGLFPAKLRKREKHEWAYGWDSDAKSDTVQSGFARGATAFIIQLIDSSVVAVADHGGWSAGKHRLPAGWFAAEVPGSDSRYAGAQFWGGHALHRVR
jgi:hypothetical protein